MLGFLDNLRPFVEIGADGFRKMRPASSSWVRRRASSESPARRALQPHACVWVCWTLNRLFELQNEEHLKTSTCYFDRADLSYTGGIRQGVAARERHAISGV
jgi:hypothetical protein